MILAGGLGTRISEESHLRPKPMIEIGGRPVLWHIMKNYEAYGINEFIICCGYKSYLIKEYFVNYLLHSSDVTVDTSTNQLTVHQKPKESWRVTLMETGESTQTGGRIKRIREHIDDTFCLTYGDGLSDVNLHKLIEFHKEKQALTTVTAVQPEGRFGALEINGDFVHRFSEKPVGDKRCISGGFFVCEPEVFDLIAGDNTVWERGPLESLAQEGRLAVYRHTGFWAAMDTQRDKLQLEECWSRDQAPWKVW